MERGSINDIPVWVKMVENVTVERTVVKESPNVDGAVVEVQGQGPQRWRLEFTLINDGEWIVSDYETASLELRAAFLSGGPFTVTMPVFGELTDLWMAEPVTLTFFDETKLAIASGGISLIEAQPFVFLQDDAAANVETSISALTEAAARDFARRIPPGTAYDGAVDTLDAGADWLIDTQGLISSAFEPVNDAVAAIQNISDNIEGLLNTPQNLASLFAATAYQLMALVPALSQQDSTPTGSAAVADDGSDKPAVVFTESLVTGADFDSSVAPTQGDVLGDDASEEDLTENDQVSAATSIVLVGITAGCCLAITSTTFATINSVISVAEALEPAFEKLFALDNLDHQVYSHARMLRSATLAFLSSESAGLPRLRSITLDKDTNLLSVLIDLYETLDSEDQVQAAVDSLASLNSVPDPTTLLAGTSLRYLDPLVA